MGFIATQKDQLWSADGIGFAPTYYFAQKSGGDRTAEITKIKDGGRIDSEILFQEATTSDITLTGLYRPADHDGILRNLRASVGKVTATLKRLDCDANKTPVGVVDQFGGCVLTGVKMPEHDSNSSTEARFELTFSVPS